MTILFTNISHLCNIEHAGAGVTRRCGAEMSMLPSVANAWLLVRDGIIHSFGKMATLPEIHADENIDGMGRLVLPAWVDSHTHLVFPAPRESEFVDRIRGLSYEQIAMRGGGILNSARLLNQMD